MAQGDCIALWLSLWVLWLWLFIAEYSMMGVIKQGARQAVNEYHVVDERILTAEADQCSSFELHRTLALVSTPVPADMNAIELITVRTLNSIDISR